MSKVLAYLKSLDNKGGKSHQHEFAKRPARDSGMQFVDARNRFYKSRPRNDLTKRSEDSNDAERR